MSETPVQPELEDELPEPTEPPKEPFVSKWDIVVFLVLLAAGGAFWFWYRGQDRTSKDHFAHADSLYVQRRLPEALAAYRQLRDAEQIVSKADDSLLYHRIDSLTELEDHATRLAQGAALAVASGDTSLMRRALDTLSADKTGFVADSARERLSKALGAKAAK